jgi:hypothetical protein
MIGVDAVGGIARGANDPNDDQAGGCRRHRSRGGIISGASADGSRDLPTTEQRGDSKLGLWHQWLTTFNDMTPKQRAEVVRRHIRMCLESFEVTDDQRAFVTTVTAQFITEDAYDFADPDKRAAVQRDMQQVQEKSMAVLGRDLTLTFFFAKPPISVLDAVWNDPAFK